MRWVYFRKKTDSAPFELFSDNASKIRHLSRILFLIGFVSGLNLFVGAYNLFLAFTIGSAVNFLGLINLVLGAGIGVLFWKYWKKKKRLVSEQSLFEG